MTLGPQTFQMKIPEFARNAATTDIAPKFWPSPDTDLQWPKARFKVCLAPLHLRPEAGQAPSHDSHRLRIAVHREARALVAGREWKSSPLRCAPQWV